MRRRPAPGRPRTVYLLAALVLCGAAARAAAVDFIAARSLAFLQHRGGLGVGEPRYVDGRWQLPLDCDVSGARSASAPGNILHTGIAWWRSVAVVEGPRVYVTIETNVQGPDAPGTRCQAADLGRIADGTYEVWYRDPDGTVTRLGDVRVSH